MKKLSWLIALGVGAYLLFAIVTLPASVLLGQLQPAGITAAGVEGTAWNGSAQVMRLQGANLGSVEWDLHALALFALKIQADVRITRPEGFAQSQVSLQRSGPVEFQGLTASLPLSVLSNFAPGGWTGTVNLRFDELILDNGWPIAATGTAEVIDLSSANQRSPISGSYKLTFPAPDTSAPADALVGALSDLGGPLQISGELQLKPDRSYLIKGVVAARPDAPRALANQLQILGPADAQGRRQFALEGTM